MDGPTVDARSELELGKTLAQEAGGTAAPLAALPTGHARYVRGRELGRGGMGRVYEAVDQQFRRSVAVKEIAADAPADALVRRFQTEAIVTGHIEHPGIPAVYERGVDGAGRPFYAMRRVQGRSLGKLLAEAQTRESRLALLAVVTRAAQTIGYAHGRGVVHRDIKPDNILVGDHGETFVLDWGLARVRGVPAEEVAAIPSAGGETQYGAVVGTPAYMAPEQAAGELDRVDERTDVFALGALLYHVLAGAAPYRGESVEQLVAAAKQAELPPIGRDAPRELVAICERATAREPSARYRDANELARALADFETRAVLAQRSPVDTVYRAIMGTTIVGAAGGAVFTWVRVSPYVDLSIGVISAFVTGLFGLTVGLIEWHTHGRHRLGGIVFAFAIATFFVAFGTAATDVAEGLRDHPGVEVGSVIAGRLAGFTLGMMVAAFELAIWAIGHRRATQRVA